MLKQAILAAAVLTLSASLAIAAPINGGGKGQPSENANPLAVERATRNSDGGDREHGAHGARCRQSAFMTQTTGPIAVDEYGVIVVFIALVGFFLYAMRAVLQAWALESTPKNLAGAAVGVHPHDAITLDDATYDELAKLAAEPEVLSFAPPVVEPPVEPAPVELAPAVELAPVVLARALDPFPVKVRTLDALHLARAGAFEAFEPGRRKAAWEALRAAGDLLPLAPAHTLPFNPMELEGQELIFLDYLATGVSLEGHPVRSIRARGSCPGRRRAPRLPWRLLDASSDVPAIPGERWAGTHLHLPRGRWESVLDDTTVEGGRPVEVAELMARWPLALLVQASDCAPDGGPAPAS